jgi:hypothetical protein
MQRDEVKGGIKGARVILMGYNSLFFEEAAK